MTNLATFHLQRHSDHHANPSRRYQCLRHFADLPQLPSGYFGMFAVAYWPRWWFRVMDPRLMALPQVRGDLARVNVCPHARNALQARWGARRVASGHVGECHGGVTVVDQAPGFPKARSNPA